MHTGTSDAVEKVIETVSVKLHLFRIFSVGVEEYFKTCPMLNGSPPVVHSVKARIKDLDHLREKIDRKAAGEDEITSENVFAKITDIAGIRVLHLYQSQFAKIHESIQSQIDRGDWTLFEPPKAYTWDPESRKFFESLNLELNVKESFYTSIHYVVKPRPDSEVTCEIQIRTLFEEIWGEIDHSINYPEPVDNLSCKEQLRVLARLVGAGSRLADSIFRIYDEHLDTVAQPGL